MQPTCIKSAIKETRTAVGFRAELIFGRFEGPTPRTHQHRYEMHIKNELPTSANRNQDVLSDRITSSVFQVSQFAAPAAHIG